MVRLFACWVGSVVAIGASTAIAGEGIPEPAMDFSGLESSAQVRPDNLNGEPHQAVARLLVDRTTLVPGETVRVGVHLDPDEGWHAYWKSPGETGEPMSIEWHVPDGLSLSEPVFPVPVRFDDQGIISFGYGENVLLFTEIVVPEGLAAGPQTLSASVGWLVCEDQCIKGEVELSTVVTVAEASEPAAWSALFDHYAAQHPQPLASVDGAAVESALSRSAVHPGETFQAVFRVVATGDEPVSFVTNEGMGSWPAFIPVADTYSVWVDDVSVKRADDGSSLVVLTVEAYELDELPENATIGGLLQFSVGQEHIATEIAIPLPWVAADVATQASISPLFGLAGISLASDGGAAEAFEIGADSEAVGAVFATTAPEIDTSWSSLFRMLGLAFVGGLILNIMPCVLPVLSLKLFGLVSHSDASAGYQRRAGLAYTAGILVSFFVLAIAVVILKATVGAVGWGFQFQSPIYVAALCTIVFVFGLSLFGDFELPALGMGAASSAAAKEGHAGDFMNGVFATLLATPCSAPFLGPAVGFAFALPSAWIVVFFLVIGLGLAIPFALVAFIPPLFRLLPRPGAWMETFKQAMGFALIGSAVWVAYPLPALIGGKSFVLFLAFLTAVGAGCWLFGRFGGVAESGQRQLVVGAAALSLAAFAGFLFLDLDYEEIADCDDNTLATDLVFEEHVPWQPFTEERLAAASAEAPVFIDFTADWCVTCKVNERTVIETQAIREAMANCGIVPLKADWTRRDEVITDWLMRYGRAGVPFYLFVPPNGEAIPLPELLTSSGLLATFAEACG